MSSFEKIKFETFGEISEFDLICTTSNGHNVVGQRHSSKPICRISESYSGKFPTKIDGTFKNEFSDDEMKFEFTCSTGLRIEKEINEAANLVLAYVRSFENQ